jgi:endonuclease/exonuclease/phosphatase family metal-dependent hydrolase
MKSINVMSYNIHKGFSINRQFTLGKIKEFIRTHHTDLVFLQEVVGQNSKQQKKIAEWPMDSQLEYLADSVWSHHAYGKNSIYDHGHHGNAILSSWPILVYENIDISTNRLEDRGLMHVVVSRDGEKIHLLCVHLDLLEKGRQIQLKKIIQRIREHIPDGEPLILAGDFNDWREKASKLFLDELGLIEVYHSLYGKHALTFPSRKPHLPLDRIYVRGFEPVAARCLTTNSLSELSDHGAMTAEIKRL